MGELRATYYGVLGNSPWRLRAVAGILWIQPKN